MPVPTEAVDRPVNAGNRQRAYGQAETDIAGIGPALPCMDIER